MPRVLRTRLIAAPPERVWALVSDPYHFPRWWPRTRRVEDVRRTGEGRRSQWTKVLETQGGKGIRADFRCTSSAERERYIFEQVLTNTPFERILRSSETEIRLEAANGSTEVTIAEERRLRGLSRLGSPMMRNAMKRSLDEALDGLERALTE